MPALLLDGSVLLQTATALMPRFRHLADKVTSLLRRPPIIAGRGKGLHRRYPVFNVDLSPDHCHQILVALEWLASHPADADDRDALARVTPAWQALCTALA